MAEKRMLIVDAEVAGKIDENRGDMSRSDFLSFLIDSLLNGAEVSTKSQAYVDKEEFHHFEQGIKELLRNLIISPAGVVYDKAIYGSKQPDGVIDLLARNNYETAAQNIHIKRNRIYLDKNYRLIEEK